jgi:hypothetical protein
VCIVLAAMLQNPINAQRKDLQLVMQSDLYKELPPKYAWVSAFGGGFRGIAVDLLWMRAEKLKEEGKYYEMHQLAKWICTLEPRFADVWSYHAWNMSYNISVATHTAEERWQWVYNGIRLLRDEGIPNNERVVALYRQLAWTWFHKVGDRSDDFHNFYKREWAATMETLLGKPPVGLSNAETIDWFRPVAEAPRSLEAVEAKHPGVRELVDQLAGLGVNVHAETDNLRVFHPLEDRFFRPYTRYLNQKNMAALREDDAAPAKTPLDAFFEQAPEADLAALLAFLRAKVLREQYKMDPEYMLAMTGLLGTDEPIPIDWRTPWSQGLYWGMYGVKRGAELKNVSEFDVINTDRIMLYALAALSKMGRYSFRINLDEPMDSFLVMSPDFRYIEAMHRKYLEMGRKHADPGEDVENRTSDMLRSGHVNNLETAIVALYMAGHEEEAQHWLDYLLKYYPNPHTGETQQKYMVTLDEFCMGQLYDMAETYAEAVRLIYGLLNRGYLAMASGRPDEFDASVRRARAIYDKYQSEAEGSYQGRSLMHEFPRLRGEALAFFVTDGLFPISYRSAVWRAEKPEVKQYAYDSAIDYLREECQREGLSVARAFPEPEGMAEWRIAHPRPTQQEHEELAQPITPEKPLEVPQE